MNPFDWWARMLPLPRRVNKKVSPGVTHSYIPDLKQTAEQDQPWIIYTFGRVHDGWWPFWRSSRIIGRMVVGAECMVCGKRKVLIAKLPRFGEVPDRGKHPLRIRFCLDHIHKDKPHPAAWARPFMNLNAWPNKSLDLDMLAMRLEADLREASK
jgi:hypothetical protein